MTSGSPSTRDRSTPRLLPRGSRRAKMPPHGWRRSNATKPPRLPSWRRSTPTSSGGRSVPGRRSHPGWSSAQPRSLRSWASSASTARSSARQSRASRATIGGDSGRLGAMAFGLLEPYSALESPPPSREDDLTAARQAVELADGDDVLHLGDEVLAAELEQVN